MEDRLSTRDHASEEEARRAFSARLLDLAGSHLSLWAIDLALRLGVLAELRDQPDGLTAAALAGRLSLDPPLTAALCRAAYTAEALDFDGTHYRLAPGAGVLLDADAPLYARGLVSVPLGLREQLERLRVDIKTGRRSWWDQIGPESLEAVADTGRAFYTRLVERVIPELPGVRARLQSGGRALELGCGFGTGLVKLAQAFPSATLLGIDGDAYSLARAEERLSAAGVRERVTVQRETFESVDLPPEFDFAYINISLHEARDKPAVVANCFRALKPGGVLAVSEFPFPEDRASLRGDPGRLLCLMQLHEVYFGGHHLTVREAQALLQQAGFADVGLIDVTPLQVVHHGTRPPSPEASKA